MAPEAARVRKSLDPGLFRRAMGSFASGVTVITTPDGEGVHGMTANAFMSGSMGRPCVWRRSPSARIRMA